MLKHRFLYHIEVFRKVGSMLRRLTSSFLWKYRYMTNVCGMSSGFSYPLPLCRAGSIQLGIFLTSTLAPLSKRTLHVSACPLVAALWSIVKPSIRLVNKSSRLIILPPRCNRKAQILACPYYAAVRKESMSAPPAPRSRTHSSCFIRPSLQKIKDSPHFSPCGVSVSTLMSIPISCCSFSKCSTVTSAPIPVAFKHISFDCAFIPASNNGVLTKLIKCVSKSLKTSSINLGP